MKQNSTALLLARVASALMAVAIGSQAQAQVRSPDMRLLVSGQSIRTGTLQRIGLGDPALNLTESQKIVINSAADAYIAEIQKLPAVTPSEPPSANALVASAKAREKFTAAVKKVLNAQQEEAWEAAQTRRHPPIRGPSASGDPAGPPIERPVGAHLPWR